MPSSITIDGARVFQPGIYATVDASALGGAGISTGNLAIVGAFPSFEKGKPKTFSNAKALTDYDPTDADLALIAKLAFAPSIDERVGGGADNLTIANVQPCTQATATLVDDDGEDSIVLNANVWGPAGNRTYYKFKTNADTPEAVDVTLVRNGITETYTALQSGPVGTVNYTGADLTTCTLEASPTTFKIAWTKALPAAVAGALVFDDTNEMLSAGAVLTLSIGAGAGAAHDAPVTVNVEGLDETGTPVPSGENVVFNVGAAGPTATTHKWSRIDKITVSTTDAEWVGIVTVAGTAFDFNPADFASIADILALIEQNSAAGFTAEAVHVRAASIPADEIDKFASASIKAAPATLRADTWAILDALSASKLVTAERADGAMLPPGPLNEDPAETVEGFLLGGTKTAPITTQNWTDALVTIAPLNVQVVHVMSTDIAIGKLLPGHCKMGALLGFERNAWFGFAANQTLEQAFSTYTSKLNTRYVSAVGHEVQVETPSGALKWVGPEYLALICAAMQCGTPVATPLTRKRPDIRDARAKWDPRLDIDEAIAKGVVTLGMDQFGWRIERSVTTHLSDDNPIYSEMSAFESAQTSVRDLRAGLQDKIGERPIGLTPNRVIGIVGARLDLQIASDANKNGFIKAYRNIQVTDLGDKYRITYELAALEPLNFIEITANVVRIPG